MFAFLLKKHLAPLFYPVPLSISLLLAGVLLLWFGKRQRWGRVMVTLGLILLVLASFRPLPWRVLHALEWKHAVYSPAAHQQQDVKWVVVLGGGLNDDPALPASHQLARPSLVRLVEGIRILQLHPEARLLLSGGAVFGSRSVASAMRDAAAMLGVDAQRITLEENPRDTEEEALFAREIVGQDPLILVTSASHVPRALALFRKQGMDPIPAPVDHATKKEQRTALLLLYPTADNLQRATAAVNEHLGLVWSRLRGRG